MNKKEQHDACMELNQYPEACGILPEDLSLILKSMCLWVGSPVAWDQTQMESCSLAIVCSEKIPEQGFLDPLSKDVWY